MFEERDSLDWSELLFSFYVPLDLRGSDWPSRTNKESRERERGTEKLEGETKGRKTRVELRDLDDSAIPFPWSEQWKLRY